MQKFINVLLILLFISCAAKQYNTPFADVEETVNLNFGMSKSSVKEAMGSLPLYVQEGDDSSTIWIYEIRTKKVLSSKDVDGTFIPNKTHRDTRPDSPVHRLALVFDGNGKLQEWGPIEGTEE